jgi:hypothetical protein
MQNVQNITLQQNYFQFDNQYCMRNTDLSMEAPTSAVVAETYQQI